MREMVWAGLALLSAVSPVLAQESGNEGAAAQPLEDVAMQVCLFGERVELVPYRPMGDGTAEGFGAWAGTRFDLHEQGRVSAAAAALFMQMDGANSILVADGQITRGTCSLDERAFEELIVSVLGGTPEELGQVRDVLLGNASTMRAEIDALDVELAAQEAEARERADDLRAELAIRETELGRLEAQLASQETQLGSENGQLNRCRIAARQAASAVRPNLARLARGDVDEANVPTVVGLVESELARIDDACRASGADRRLDR